MGSLGWMPAKANLADKLRQRQTQEKWKTIYLKEKDHVIVAQMLETSLFVIPCSSLLSCTNEYLAMDSGG